MEGSRRMTMCRKAQRRKEACKFGALKFAERVCSSAHEAGGGGGVLVGLGKVWRWIGVKIWTPPWVLRFVGSWESQEPLSKLLEWSVWCVDEASWNPCG